MSKIGRNPISIVKGVEVNIKEGTVSIKGPKGGVSLKLPKTISAEIDKGFIKLVNTDKEGNNSLYGLYRTKINNMVVGVTEAYSKELNIFGVGYRAQLSGDVLQMSLGFSHPVDFKLPKGVTAAVDKQTVVKLSSIDKDLLGETAAKIRNLRPPEPYKGKGVRYANEHILRKAGKVAGAAKGGK